MALSVIGAGHGRTGTASLKIALEELGFGPCHHMSELLAHPETWDFWARAYRGEPADFEIGYKGFRSGVDDPTTSFWAPLAERYPNAKVILSVRDAEGWYKSGQDSVLSQDMVRFIENAPPQIKPFIDLFEPMGWDPRNPKTHDRDYMIGWFKRHNEEVKRRIVPSRLLVYQVSDGWAPLCRFLDVPVPEKPFPRVNSTAEFLAMIKAPTSA